MLNFNELQADFDVTVAGRTARNRLIETIRDEMKPYAAKLIGPQRAPQSEDQCVNDACVKALENFDRFDNVRHLFFWMRTVLRGIIFDRHLGFDRLPAEPTQAGPQSILDLFHDLEKSEADRRKIEQIVKKIAIVLDDRQRELIQMRLVWELPYPAIADKLGYKDEHDARNKLMATLQFLRFCLSDINEEVF